MKEIENQNEHLNVKYIIKNWNSKHLYNCTNFNPYAIRL